MGHHLIQEDNRRLAMEALGSIQKQTVQQFHNGVVAIRDRAEGLVLHYACASQQLYII